MRKLIISMTMCHHCPLLRVVEKEGGKEGDTWNWACGYNEKMREVPDAEFIPKWCPIPDGGSKEIEGG
jgi:hypothetical protein